MKSKSLKKASDGDRSRLKNSKSEKRKRRYPSSDSAHNRKKKPRNLKESKKKSRKKPRNISTSPSSSSYSSNYSTSSCSTCEKRKPSRSRSPIFRGNKKAKAIKSRVSNSSKYKGRERGRSHRRSSSCSTCSRTSSRSSSQSRSPSRSRRLRKEREKAERAQVLSLVEPCSEERDNVILAYDDFVSSPRDDKNKIERGTNDKQPSSEALEKVVPEKTQNEGTKKQVVDVELILRQKALENFIKFHKFKKSSNGEQSEEPVSDKPNNEVGSVQDAKNKEREEPVLDEPTEEIGDKDSEGKAKIISDILVKRPKIRSVITIPTEREVCKDNTAIDTCDTGLASNSIGEVPKHVEDEMNKGFEPNPTPNTNPSSSVDSGLGKKEAVHEGTRGIDKTGGAQFENKTFSRLHDGEMVQASYKVYIPKKGPALARRKLLRGETSTS